MILNNYKNYMRSTIGSSIQLNGASAPVDTIKDMSGTVLTGVCFATTMDNNASFPKRGLDVVLGSGNTAPTASDYALDQDESSDLTITTTATQGVGTNGWDLTLTVTVENTSASDITVKEVGIRKQIYTGVSSYEWVLWARFLLDTPITITAGAGTSIAFKWSEV